MSNPIVSLDEQAMRDELRELVRNTIEETATTKRPTSSSARRRTSAPTKGRHTAPATMTAASPRHPGRSRSRCQDQGDEVRNRRHRSIQKARGLGRGGHHRDAPGRGIHPAHRGRQRDHVGRGRFRRRGLQPEREGVQSGRRMAVPAVDLRMPVRLHRRHLPERSWGGSYENVAVMVAIGVNEDGYRELGASRSLRSAGATSSRG